MMSYVSFQRPGINVIYATVVWDQNNNTKNLKQRFLAKQDRFQWKNYVIEYHGAIFVPEYHTDCYTKTGIASLEMKIDEKLFAPEPFDKNWVNLFMEYNASNQCNYRKRRLFAYTIQIMMMFISFIIRLGSAIFFMLIGMRGINYKAVYQLVKKDLDDVYYDKTRSVFTYKNIGERQPFFFVFAMPIWYIPIGLSVFFLTLVDQDIPTALIWQLPLILLGFFASITVAFYTVFLIADLIISSVSKILNVFPDKKTEKLEEVLNQKYLEWTEITCEPSIESKPVSVSSLPKNKQTIYLRYMNIKAKVCKPFAI